MRLALSEVGLTALKPLQKTGGLGRLRRRKTPVTLHRRVFHHTFLYTSAKNLSYRLGFECRSARLSL